VSKGPARLRLLACAAALLTALGCAVLGLGSPSRAIQRCGELFRQGDMDGAAKALAPYLDTDPGAREALALRFLCLDYPGVLELAARRPSAAADDEARLWVARSQAALGRWAACQAELACLRRPERPAALSLKAEALAAAGSADAPAAMAQALSACAGSSCGAVTALLAAEDAQRRGDDALAEQDYKLAERWDQAYSLVNLRLAALYRKQERWKDVRVRLERARRVDPDAEGPRLELNALLAALPEQRQALRRDAVRKAQRFLDRENPVVAALPLWPGEPTVRVGLLTAAPRFRCRLGGDMRVLPQGLAEDAAAPVPTPQVLPAGSSWEARQDAQGWMLRPLGPAKGQPPLRFDGVLRLEPVDPSTTFGLFQVDHGAGYFWAGQEDRYYRGALELRPAPTGLTLVNELGLESYLLSVVPSEAPARWPAAALRAQAIAARSDAWRSLGRFRSAGYDLCPTVLCAVYAGVGAEDPRTSDAVTATTGVVLEQPRGRLAATYYMDNSGGHTLDADQAWSSRDGRTKGVVDAPAAAAATWALFPVTPSTLLHFIDDPDNDLQAWPRNTGSTWRWILRLTPEELAPSVDRRHGVGPLKSVQGEARSDGGYLLGVRLIGLLGQSEASSDRIRSAFKGIKSNLFYVEQRLDKDGATVALIFHGGGWGHGVGMSQSGAKAMADAALDERSILLHYFPAAALGHRYGKP
jgi:SpoIID/LytB domain protein